MIYTMQGLENDHPIREMLFNLLPTEIPERADIAPEGADALGVVVEQAGAENRIRVCCVRGGKQICAENVHRFQTMPSRPSASALMHSKAQFLRRSCRFWIQHRSGAH